MTRARIDVVLVQRGFFESRARAQAAIAAGLVMVDGAVVRKPSDSVMADAQIEAQTPHPYVSRGGVKLAHALHEFSINPQGLHCLDVGSSTGGFTDALFQRGAAHVLAIDTGRGQMHASLRGHPGLTLLEETDIRRVSAAEYPQRAMVIAVDVSFISLTLIVPVLANFAAPGCHLVVLVKPQFEVGKKFLGKNGIVTDSAAQAQAVQDIRACMAAEGWHVQAQCDSPITGGDGNREYLVHARRPVK